MSSACSHSNRLKVKVKAIQQLKVSLQDAQHPTTHPDPSQPIGWLTGTLRFALHLPVPSLVITWSGMWQEAGTNPSLVETSFVWLDFRGQKL